MILTLLSEFFINKWIVPACFIDIGESGLSKDFYLDTNCKDNLKMLGEVTILFIINSNIDDKQDLSV